MRAASLALLLQAAAAPGPRPQAPCANIPAAAVIERLSDLPTDIRQDLLQTYEDMEERGAPLLSTDSPTEGERKYPTSRFVQAVLIKNVWYVQFEVSMFAGVRTMGYVRASNGRFRRDPSRYYGGPACATLRAAIEGVYNPGPSTR